MNSLLGQVKSAAAAAGVSDDAIKNTISSAGLKENSTPAEIKDAAVAAGITAPAAPAAPSAPAVPSDLAAAATPVAPQGKGATVPSPSALEGMITQKVKEVAGDDIANSAQAKQVIGQIADAVGDKVPANLLNGAAANGNGAATNGAAPPAANALLGKAMGMFGK